MQSWGTRARWDIRDSGAEPTKSGVVGLLGCALGLERRHPRLEELDAQIKFAVRTDQAGVLATDYHTITGRHRMAHGKLKTEEYTVQSYRDYLFDASFLVALEGSNDLLSELAEALEHPYWPLFLGRKSCPPTRKIFEAISSDFLDLEEAMRTAPWSPPHDPRLRRTIARSVSSKEIPAAILQWAGTDQWEKTGPEYRLNAWIEDERGEVQRQDAIRNNELRFYDFRSSRKISVPISNLELLEN